MKNDKIINRMSKGFAVLFAFLLLFPLLNSKNVQADTPLELSAVTSSWQDGYSVNMTITNTLDTVVDDWTLVLNESDFAITNIWSAQMKKPADDTVIITPNAWNKSIRPGEKVSFGFVCQGTFNENFNYSLTPAGPGMPTPTPTRKITPTPTIRVTPTPTIRVTPTPKPTPTIVTPTPGITKIKGSEVLVIGDSFLAMSREITKTLEQHAKSDGILDSNDRFRDNSVSGTMLTGGISPTIPNQYKNGASAGTVKYVVMDGGGNDCLSASGGAPYTTLVTNSTNSLNTLFSQMQKDGVLKVFYLFYPDPMQDMGGLKSKLDVLRPRVQELTSKLTSPKTTFLDLRPTFEGKYSQYILSDGIHPSSAGSKATGDAIWEIMKKTNFFSAN